MKALVLILASGLVALGCQKSEAPAPAASAAPAAAPSAAPAASVAADPAVPAADSAAALAAAAPAAAPAAAAKAVPTEADYEVQAQSAITPTNAAQVLAAIEKQVGN
jgi:hypothetical protein